MPVGYLSGGTTNFSNISLYGDGGVLTSRISSNNTAIFPQVWASGVSVGSIVTASRVSSSVTVVAAELWGGTSGLSLQGGLRSSGLTLDLRTNSVVLSLDTRANSSAMTTGQLRLVFAASGISLVYSSGATVYTIGASAVSAAQA